MGSTAIAECAELRWPENLRSYLHSQGISAVSFARRLGVPRGTVTGWWTGALPISLRSREALQTWCRSEGLDLDQLLASADVHDLATERASRGQAATSLSSRSRKGGSDGTQPPPPPGPPEDDVQVLTREFLTPDELEYFGLPADPFEDDNVAPDEIFLPKGLQAVEQALARAIRGRKIIALVGPPGSGKSAILRRMWAMSAREKRIRLIAPALMDRRRVSLATLSVAILRDLIERDTSNMAGEPRAELLRRTLQDQVDAGMFPTIFIDEAHDLSNTALISIKRLWDSHVLFRQLSVVLVGQHPLAARLRSDPTLAELTGRTQLMELPAYGPEVVAAYIHWRVARVGVDPTTLFSAPGLAAIATRADRPLWINNVAVLALRQARLIGDQQVVPTHVGRV